MPTIESLKSRKNIKSSIVRPGNSSVRPTGFHGEMQNLNGIDSTASSWESSKTRYRKASRSILESSLSKKGGLGGVSPSSGMSTKSTTNFHFYVTLFLVTVIALTTLPQSTQALLCYETDGEGNAQLKNTTHDFCVFWPDSLDDDTDVSLFSVGPSNDAVKEYRNVFKLSHKPEFDVLSMCVFERYSIGAVDYAFRCFCNFDRCNKAMNLNGFLKRLVKTHA